MHAYHSLTLLISILLSLTREQLSSFRCILVTSSVPIRESLLISHYSKYNERTHEISLPSRSIESMLSTSRSHIVKNSHIVLAERNNLSVRFNSGRSDGFGKHDGSPVDCPGDEDGSY